MSTFIEYFNWRWLVIWNRIFYLQISIQMLLNRLFTATSRRFAQLHRTANESNSIEFNGYIPQGSFSLNWSVKESKWGDLDVDAIIPDIIDIWSFFAFKSRYLERLMVCLFMILCKHIMTLLWVYNHSVWLHSSSSHTSCWLHTVLLIFLFLDSIKKTFTRSNAPGGQNVNKSSCNWLICNIIFILVETKAEIRIHVSSAEWLSPELRQLLAEKYSNRINIDGELIISSQRTRSQVWLFKI